MERAYFPLALCIFGRKSRRAVHNTITAVKSATIP